MDKTKLYAGAAKVSIVPPEDWFPIEGGVPLTGVYSEIFARALILHCGGKSVVFIAFDLGAPPEPTRLREMVQAEYGIPMSNVFVTATHNHSAYGVYDENPQKKYVGTMKKMTDFCVEKGMQAVREAMADVVPARYGIGHGESYVNVCRDQEYDDGWDEGINFARPSDKELVVMRVERYDGTPIALWVNYGVHATAEGQAGKELGKARISGDLPGRTSLELEKKYPGCVALWVAAAAGDQNPIVRSWYASYAEDGSHTWDQIGEACRGPVTAMCKIHARDAVKTAEAIAEYYDAAEITTSEKVITLPGQKPDLPGNDIIGGSALRGIPMVETDPVTLPLAMLKLGDAIFYFISGELVSPIGMALKEHSPYKHTFIITLNGRYVSYIPDLFGYDVQSFEYRMSKIARNDNYKSLADAFDEMLGEVTGK